MSRLTYSVSEVAELLGISRSKAYDLVAQGMIPVVALRGRRRLVPRWAIDELLTRAPRDRNASSMSPEATSA
jgi:excisionase family DNA binding protein